MTARTWQEVRADRTGLPPVTDSLVFGQFYQISSTMGIVVCDGYTLPPTVLEDQVQPEGWVLDGPPLDVNVGDDGYLECFVYTPEGFSTRGGED